MGSGGGPGSGGVTGVGGATGGECDEPGGQCLMSTGLTYGCKQRFALGVNYAWRVFAGDFGGIPSWDEDGVSDDRPGYGADLAEMKENGVSVIRWWMYPEFRGGISFDENDDPTGLTATAVADIKAALDLAAEHDVYLALTIFSFDNFRPSRTEFGLYIPGITPLVQDANRRGKLMDSVVRPIAQTVAASPNADRVLAWDVINEPEWAVSATGDVPPSDDFAPNGDLDAVSLAEMKALINETAAILHEETPNSLVSVGWAAAKWEWAFDDVTTVDFHQPHIYGWVNQYWPYTSTPSELGYGDKPTVMGEFHLESMPFSGNGDDSTFATIVGAWYDGGYAGAWAWQHYDAGENLPLIKSFADEKGCTVEF